MSRITGVRLGTELQAKLDRLCKDTQQCKSDVLRQALRVVSAEQLQWALQVTSKNGGSVLAEIDACKSHRQKVPLRFYN